MLMNTKAILLGFWHGVQGALIVIILGLFIMYAFYPCLLETVEIQMEASHVTNK